MRLDVVLRRVAQLRDESGDGLSNEQLARGGGDDEAHVVDAATGDDASGFLHRTFCDRSRWGKVIFRYDPR
jgi:hypothetical protein